MEIEGPPGSSKSTGQLATWTWTSLWRSKGSQLIALVSLVLGAILFFYTSSAIDLDGDVTIRSHGGGSTVKTRQENSPNANGGASSSSLSCQPGTCPSRVEARRKAYHGDLLNRFDLLRMVRIAKEKMEENIRKDYGDYYEAIFEGVGKSFDPMSSVSLDRLKRKMTIKVLEVQTKILKEDECDCSFGEEVNTKEKYVKYVWATGGHSSAAGHGNLFNESYTAYMGRDARPVFGAIGIEFEDRNYAMGGTASGSEISFCWEQIFGTDVDFFSWDYGMTDGQLTQRLMHYGYRGGISSGRPALMGIRVGGRSRSTREGTLRNLESLGMATFYGSDESYESRNKGVPDSAGLTMAEINALPFMVRNLRCGIQYESGDPFCKDEKYSKEVCTHRKKQAKWHPGFKMHALDGHALGLFLSTTLIDVLEDLAENEESDPFMLLARLKEEENQLFEDLRNADLPEDVINSLYIQGESDKNPLDPSLDLKAWWSGPSLCRTARLPAQSRFLGYTTDTERRGDIAAYGSEKYDTGIPEKTAAVATGTSDGEVPLVYSDGERTKCDVVVMPDAKDVFYIKGVYGKARITMPNKKEQVAYAYDPSKFKGLIMISFVLCEFGKCKGDLRGEAYAGGKFEISVNGEPVVELVNAGLDIWLLKGQNGYYWPHNQEGIFHVDFLVKNQNDFVKISSIILT